MAAELAMFTASGDASSGCHILTICSAHEGFDTSYVRTLLVLNVASVGCHCKPCHCCMPSRGRVQSFVLPWLSWVAHGVIARFTVKLHGRYAGTTVRLFHFVARTALYSIIFYGSECSWWVVGVLLQIGHRVAYNNTRTSGTLRRA